MSKEIYNSDDVIDSRDVIERIRELESERDTLESDRDDRQEELDEAQAALDNFPDTGSADTTELTDKIAEAQAALDAAKAALAKWDESDEGEELKKLQALQEGAEGYSDWRHGAQLIRDSYFETYARETAEELHGDAMRDASWPFSCIDWEQAAKELQTDYTSVDFDGETYWVRS